MKFQPLSCVSGCLNGMTFDLQTTNCVASRSLFSIFSRSPLGDCVGSRVSIDDKLIGLVPKTQVSSVVILRNDRKRLSGLYAAVSPGPIYPIASRNRKNIEI